MSTISSSPTTIIVDPRQIDSSESASSSASSSAASSGSSSAASASASEASEDSIASVDKDSLTVSLEAKKAKLGIKGMEEGFANKALRSESERPSRWHPIDRHRFNKEQTIAKAHAQAAFEAGQRVNTAAARLSALNSNALYREVQAESKDGKAFSESALGEYLTAQKDFQSEMRALIKATGTDNAELLLMLQSSEFRLSEGISLYHALQTRENPEIQTTTLQEIDDMGLTKLATENKSAAELMHEASQNMHANDIASAQIFVQSFELITDIETIAEDAKPSELVGLLGKVDDIIASLEDRIALGKGEKLASAQREGASDTDLKLAAANPEASPLLESLASYMQDRIEQLRNLQAQLSPVKAFAEVAAQALPEMPADLLAVRELPSTRSLSPAYQALSTQEEKNEAISTWAEDVLYVMQGPSEGNIRNEERRAQAAANYVALREEIIAIAQEPGFSLADIGRLGEEGSLMQKLASAYAILDNANGPTPAVPFSELAAIANFAQRADVGFEEYIAKAFEGKSFNAAAIIEGKLRGIPPEHIFNAEQIALTDTGVRERGLVNTVRHLTYIDSAGVEHAAVFKPEASAQAGLAARDGYTAGTNVTFLNIASSVVAEAIGCGESIPSTSFASVEGIPGIMMSKAAGVPVRALEDGKAAFDLNGEKVTFETMCEHFKQTPGLFEKMCQSLFMGLTRLEWADALSGQVDRHAGNYMMDISPDGEVKITGIDNDFSFPATKRGMLSFDFTGEAAANSDGAPIARILGQNLTFADPLLGISRSQTPDDPSKELYRSSFGEPVSVGSVVVTALNLSRAAVPAYIPQDIYDKLMDIDETAYEESLKGLMSEEMLGSAMSRLKDAKVHAQELKDLGRMLLPGAEVDLSSFEPLAEGDHTSLKACLAPSFVYDFMSPTKEGKIFIPRESLVREEKAAPSAASAASSAASSSVSGSESDDDEYVELPEAPRPPISSSAFSASSSATAAAASVKVERDEL